MRELIFSGQKPCTRAISNINYVAFFGGYRSAALKKCKKECNMD